MGRAAPPKAFGDRNLANGAIAICLGALLALFVFELLTPENVTVSGLAIVPCVAAGWLVSTRRVVTVAVFGMVLQLILGFAGELNWLTVLTNAAAIGIVSSFAHLAATNSAQVRFSRERELSLLLATAKSFTAAEDLDAVLTEVVRATAAFIGHGDLGVKARATVWRVTGDYVTVTKERDDLGLSLLGIDFRMSRALKAIADGRRAQAVTLSDFHPDMARAYADAGVSAAACAPLHVSGRLFGLLTAGSRDNVVFTSAELRLLDGISDLASLAIANAERLEVERRRSLIFESLHEVALELAGESDSRRIGELIVERAKELADADVALLALREEGTRLLRVLAESETTRTFVLRPGRGILGRCLNDSQPQLSDEASDWERELATAVPGARSVAAFPLLARNQAIGVLVIAGPAPIAPHIVQSLAPMTVHLGSVLEQMRLRADLVSSERRFRSLYASLGCGVLVHDANGMLDDTNGAAREILQLSARDLASHPPFGAGWDLRLQDGSPLPASLRPPEYVIAFKRPIRNLVVNARCPDGRMLPLRIDSSAIEEDGKVAWVVTTFFELTPQPDAKPDRPRATARSPRARASRTSPSRA